MHVSSKLFNQHLWPLLLLCKYAKIELSAGGQAGLDPWQRPAGADLIVKSLDCSHFDQVPCLQPACSLLPTVPSIGSKGLAPAWPLQSTFPKSNHTSQTWAFKNLPIDYSHLRQVRRSSHPKKGQQPGHVFDLPPLRRVFNTWPPPSFFQIQDRIQCICRHCPETSHAIYQHTP